MALNEGQLVTYALDEIIETVQNLTPMASKVTKYTPPAESMQRSSNTVWMPVEQEAPTQTGWDLTGKATGILELSVKCNMGDPDNDFFELRADDLRDERSYRRRIQASAKNWRITLSQQLPNRQPKWAHLLFTIPAQLVHLLACLAGILCLMQSA